MNNWTKDQLQDLLIEEFELRDLRIVDLENRIRILIDGDELLKQNTELRRALDNIKVRSYELGQRELHDMACAALQEKEG